MDLVYGYNTIPQTICLASQQKSCFDHGSTIDLNECLCWRLMLYAVCSKQVETAYSAIYVLGNPFFFRLRTQNWEAVCSSNSKHETMSCIKNYATNIGLHSTNLKVANMRAFYTVEHFFALVFTYFTLIWMNLLL